MRKLFCLSCAARPLFSNDPIRGGTYELLPRSDIGEPAEMIRAVKGIARRPTPEQRMMYVNEQPFPMSIHAYNCDRCDCDLLPGTEIWCVTIWAENRPQPPLWESEFIHE